ncbi:hypothetical protein ACEWY4_007018 [Coilia grayii]|uniref:YqaJ viral recombinase domain-containing protein n=1 Tax=Coilia grayii TaxID=363190 RepID=A0ABD1KF28_9TELE
MYPPPREYRALSQEVSVPEKEAFRRGLSELGRFTGLGWLMSSEPPQPPPSRPPIPTVHSVITSATQGGLTAIIAALAITEEQRRAVHIYTLQQQNNPAWFELRKGRLTASNFGHVLATKPDCPARAVLKRVMGQSSLGGVKSVQWGIDNEGEGIRALQEKVGIHVEPSGLWLTKSGMLGASPDGLVGNSAVVEVKCPYKHRNTTVEEAIQDAAFYLEKKGHQYHLKTTHPYWHQVQGQMHIVERNECFFVVWTTKDCIVLQIQKDEVWVQNIPLLESFYKRHVLPAFMEASG